MGKETIVEVTKLGFTIRATVRIIGKDSLITLTGGDTPHVGVVATFSRDTEMRTVRFPNHDGRLHKDGVSAEKTAVIIKTAVPGSCTITSGIYVDRISNTQINASFPMSEELGYKVLDWLEKIDLHIKKPVYYKDGGKPLRKKRL